MDDAVSILRIAQSVEQRADTVEAEFDGLDLVAERVEILH
jgi:hypothetical protein